MKKWLCLLLCMGMLTGCSAGVYETIGNVEHVSGTMPQMRRVVLELPGDAAILTASGGDTMYICGNYSLAVQTLAGGDLQKTIQTVSGFHRDQITVMEQVCGDHRRYDFVWTAAGEGGDTVCRAAVIDDGNYHYCMVAMAEAGDAGPLQKTWNDLFGSFCLEEEKAAIT